MVSHLFAYVHQLRSLLFPHGYFSFLLFPFSFFIARLLVYSSTHLRNFAKFRRYVFLTSLNTAQKVKKFKTLTSVKKFLGSLTKKIGRSRKIFLLKKKNVFLKRKNFLLKRKKILLQRKFSGGRLQKKESIAALLNLYANIHYFSAKSKSAFRGIFTKVNSLTPSFAILE